MFRKILVLVGLIFVFFFGEIALTFSDKGNSFIIDDQEVAFSLKLENEYSDFVVTKSIDNNIESFLDRWDIQGASVAITKDEELVYAKGFGYANTEKNEEVKPGHLFRIASVSKLITAVAIMRLVEEGELSLDDAVFGPAGVLDTTYFPEYKDPRMERIRIRHLLNHTGGWSKRSGDPMFNSLYIARKMDIEPPADLDLVISYALSKRLYYEPGTRYSYSNLGYGILGKVIEVVSGMPYEDYVVMNILKPAGIHDMHIGKSYQHEKLPNEVKYYTAGKVRKSYSIDGSGKMVPVYYGGNNIELLGAAGGWIASAPELVKFLTSIDGFPGQRDILTEEVLDQMVNKEEAGQGLFGWRGSDDYGTWWRTGYFDGTTAMLVRQKDGVNWVILMNTSTYKQSRIQRYMYTMMSSAVHDVEIWPYLNLFLVDQEIPDPISQIPESNPNL